MEKNPSFKQKKETIKNYFYYILLSNNKPLEKTFWKAETTACYDKKSFTFSFKYCVSKIANVMRNITVEIYSIKCVKNAKGFHIWLMKIIRNVSVGRKKPKIYDLHQRDRHSCPTLTLKKIEERKKVTRWTKLLLTRKR